MKKDLLLIGKVVSGVKQGAYFTQVDWVLKQCQEKLGFKPYPGTLNLEISEEYLPNIEILDKMAGIGLISPDPKFCNAKSFPVSIGDSNGAIIIPDAEVRVHDKNIVEIIAPLMLKGALKIDDGDVVTVIVNIPQSQDKK
jgi:CTP-dependent riboflavin kinase